MSNMCKECDGNCSECPYMDAMYFKKYGASYETFN